MSQHIDDTQWDTPLETPWFRKPTQQDPPAELDDRFYALLKNAKTQSPIKTAKQNLWPRWAQISVAAAACVGAFWLGRFTDSAPGVELLPNDAVLSSDSRNTELGSPKQSKPTAVQTMDESKASSAPVVFVAKTKTPRVEKSSPILAEIADLKQQMQETKQLLMLSMLKKDSPSERIKAVNYALDFDRADAQVIEVLVKTLNEDPNANVRLAAVEALARFGNSQTVRDALMKTLNRQSDPILQLSVIESLVSMREKRALPQMQTLLENAQTDAIVKEKIQESISLLTI